MEIIIKEIDHLGARSYVARYGTFLSNPRATPQEARAEAERWKAGDRKAMECPLCNQPVLPNTPHTGCWNWTFGEILVAFGVVVFLLVWMYLAGRCGSTNCV
jgi:hypothetical protein